MNQDDDFAGVVARERAQRRTRRWKRSRIRLRVHLWVFAAVNLGLVAAWATQGAVFGHGHPPWFAPVTVGWLVAVAVHVWGIRQLRPGQ